MEPPTDLKQLYDPPRSKMQDVGPTLELELQNAGFSKTQTYGVLDYEKAVSGKKRKLFGRLLQGLPRKDAVVVELGMGSFPNALYYRGPTAPMGMDIIGVDPNDRMEKFAQDSAKRSGLLAPETGGSVRVVHGVAETLPLATGTVDAVVCTLTLCSVVDPERAVAEVRRVLKPGGQFLFLEHVLCETNKELAELQRTATPAQVKRADGCHYDRRTLEIVRAGGFSSVDGEYFELKNFKFLNPTVSGLAVA